MEPRLTDEEAQAMLARLTKHYSEPVMPISRYCQGLQNWQRALHERAKRLRVELFPDLALDWRDDTVKDRREKAAAAYMETKRLYEENPYGPSTEESPRHWKLMDLFRDEKLAEAVDHVFLQIRKSNLLARLLYGGEKLRTKMCPEHKGRWSGLEWQGNRCPHGCQLTGWIPESEQP